MPFQENGPKARVIRKAFRVTYIQGKILQAVIMMGEFMPILACLEKVFL